MRAQDFSYALRSRVGKNMTWLGLLQVANYLIPLIVIPVVARVLGTARFGQVSYAQNIITYLTIFITYGFEFSATRQIAVAKDNEREIFWSVLAGKGFLLVSSYVILAFLPLFVPRMELDMRLYWYTALTNIGLTLFPTWYLQGKQDMRVMALMNFLVKLVGAVLVVLMVRTEDDYRIYPLLLSLASIGVGFMSLMYVIRRYDLRFEGIGALKECMRQGWPIFLNNMCVSLYTTMNLTILGMLASDAEVGCFSGAQRLIQAVIMMTVMPVSTALFPKIAATYEADSQAGRRLMWCVLGAAAAVSAIVSLLVYGVAPWVVELMLGDKFAASLPLLRLMAPLPLLVMVATILTVQGVYALGLQRWAPLIGLLVAVVCISSNWMLIPIWGAAGAVAGWCIAELAEIVLDLVILFWFRLK